MGAFVVKIPTSQLKKKQEKEGPSIRKGKKKRFLHRIMGPNFRHFAKRKGTYTSFRKAI